MLHETSFQLTNILSAVKTGLQSYYDTSYSRGGVNQMWILENSKHLLEYTQSRSLSSCNSIKTFDFSTLYTTIPHSKLKDRLRKLVQLCFIKKNANVDTNALYLEGTVLILLKKQKQKKTTLNLPKRVLWKWYHQYARIFDWQHIYYIWWTCLATDSRHTYGYKLCFSSRRLVPLFKWGRLHTGASQDKWKEASPII
jgi:hypothetical protein